MWRGRWKPPKLNKPLLKFKKPPGVVVGAGWLDGVIIGGELGSEPPSG